MLTASIIVNISSLFLCSILSLVALLIIYYKWSFQYWKKRGICFLEPSIPFGNLINHLTRKISRMEEIENLYKELKKKGHKHCGIYQLAAPTYFVIDLDIAKAICIKDFEHFVDRGIFHNPKDDPISCHLLAINGNWWKRMRSKISMIFTATKLRRMFQNVLDCTDTMVEHLDKMIDDGKQPIEAKHDLFSCFTTDSVGSCTLGIKCNSFTDPEKNFVKYGKKVLEVDKAGQARFLFGISFPNLARKLGLRQVTKDVSDFFYNVVVETVATRRAKNIERNDFLQLLMEMQQDKENGISMDDLVAHSFGLYIGGFETSSSSLSFCIYELAKQPEYQEKARREIIDVLSRYNNKVTYDALAELKFTKQCMYETLRLHSPVHILNRTCTKDWKVPGEDLIIEKDIKVLIPLTAFHKDPDFYERPLDFYPDHFSEEQIAKRHPFAYIPFGAGNRKCIGERFGKMQFVTGLAVVLSRYRITLDTKTDIPLKMLASSIIPVAENGIWVNFERL